jgi:hypothetical protein
MKLSRRFWSLHVPQLSFFFHQPKIWEVGPNPTTCSMQVHQLQVLKLKISPPEQQIPQLVQCKSNNYNCKSHNCKSLHAPQLSFFFYQMKIWEVGVGQRRRGFMLSVQQENWLKLVFSWFLPDVLTGWIILPKPSFINQRLGWWNSVGKFDLFMFHNYHSSYYQPKIWEVWANPTTCSLQVHQMQVLKLKITPPEQQIPQLVQCKSNNYNCKSHNCKSLHAPQLSFFFYQSKIWEVGVGQRRRGLMLSIQIKNRLKTNF